VRPRRTRELLEAWLDALSWEWSRSISLWIDETVVIEEAATSP